MKNEAIIKALPNLKALKRKHKALDRQVDKLWKQKQQVGHEIVYLERVTEIFEDVALCVIEDDYQHGRHATVNAVDDSIGRWAEVYPNAHTEGKDWGLYLRTRASWSSGLNENWCGCGWAFVDACLVARRWTALGESPTAQYQKMARLRHELDPKRRASAKRVLAFEAAVEAGNIDLAKELLIGRSKHRSQGVSP